MIVWLNGNFLPAAEATVSAFDRGFLYGDGLFETMRAYRGRIFRWADHWERLAASAAALELSLPAGADETAGVLRVLLKKNELADARLRLTLSRGATPGRLDLKAERETLLAVAEPLRLPDPAAYREGVRLEIASFRRGRAAPNVIHKSLSYLPSLLARHEARARGAFEALLLNEAGELAEGATSSFFFVSEGAVCLPAAAAGILPGITRRVVAELCRERNLAWREGAWTPADLAGADEAFLGNSVLELVPVAAVGERRFGPPCPGPVTAALAAAYSRLVTGG